MSPSDEITTIEMSPNLEVSTGGRIGKDSDELQGVTTGRDIGKSRKRRTETGRCRSADGDGAVKLIDGLAGESPASASCPVGTVVISGDGAGDQTVGSPDVKVLDGWT